MRTTTSETKQRLQSMPLLFWKNGFIFNRKVCWQTVFPVLSERRNAQCEDGVRHAISRV